MQGSPEHVHVDIILYFCLVNSLYWNFYLVNIMMKYLSQVWTHIIDYMGASKYMYVYSVVCLFRGRVDSIVNGH